jgi:hypothetical protein
MIDPQLYVQEALHIVVLVMQNLSATEVAKLLKPAPEGYRYEIQTARVLPEANPVPASPFTEPSVVVSPLQSTPPVVVPPVAFEYRGLSCETHGQQAHRRPRKTDGPWLCGACTPETA